MTNTTFIATYKTRTIDSMITEIKAINAKIAQELKANPAYDVKKLSYKLTVEKVKYSKKNDTKAELGYSIYYADGGLHVSMFGQVLEVFVDKNGKAAFKATRDKFIYSDNSKRALNSVENVVKTYVKALGIDNVKYENFKNRLHGHLANQLHAYYMATDALYVAKEEKAEKLEKAEKEAKAS